MHFAPLSAQQVDPHDTQMFDAKIYDAVQDHMEAKFGPLETVLHEVFSPDIHLDVLPIPPGPDRDFWVFSTAGMSYREMTLPPDIQNREVWLRAEVMVVLPAEWFKGDDLNAEMKNEGAYYPIRRLKEIARYPHNAGTSILASHTFMFGEPLGPGTEMNSVIIWWPTVLRDGDDVVQLSDGGNVNLFALIPIYEAERDFAMTFGSEALLSKLADAGVTSVFDPVRPPVVQ